jgi:hypothetical protein|uniref:Uncharacterized protein n=1 Tax=Eutreptiella gymnastica TaxID=73025 RepID=A0A7S4CYG8_9EUGL|eukprot:CAMPEP_0174300284 /NCGR_PEP_ID=MMETSP0809-20121228/58374_1 /TAXON_ID=73025 ORGANISM="Eutreptiella gymnastica-like, Strain CCMP1594" /NCGR_SAMPLE_ID=MMETSP0809 /ASSEMBLY_ACC=CAM_ASM_000658 /LENGTH=113 /DNA_ID=CAMNT_0015405841 /DNA_START=453 /DNA_END=794 /DNA_ORIENTATION=-
MTKWPNDGAIAGGGVQGSFGKGGVQSYIKGAVGYAHAHAHDHVWPYQSMTLLKESRQWDGPSRWYVQHLCALYVQLPTLSHIVFSGQCDKWRSRETEKETRELTTEDAVATFL